MAILGAFMVPHPPIIIEEVGQGREKEIIKTINAYQRIAQRIGELKPDTIILISPHSVMYADYFHISPGASAEGNFGGFGAGHVRIKARYDQEFVEALNQTLKENDFDGGTLGERDRMLDHGTMIPLYFINQEYQNYKIVRIGVSGLPLLAHYTLGEYIKETSEQMNRRIVVVASGDLSHRLTKEGPYGYQEEGPRYDSRIMDIMGAGDFMELFHFKKSFCDNAGECGHRSFVMMAGTLDRTEIESRMLSYEGPFGVGYGICEYLVKGPDKSRNFGDRFAEEYRKEVFGKPGTGDAYVKLARKALESYVTNRKIIRIPEYLPEEMIKNRAGVFVSIKKNGHLRGCIGTISSTRDSVAEEIIYNAIKSGTQDPRFQPITKDELSDLDINVDVLGEKECIHSKDELDVKRYGVIVSKGSKRGLLLPNLDGIDSVDEQISIAKEKAGIEDHEEVELERFEVVRHV